ncbi:LLM class flavin-dependent oxidoreductase [uncultured Amnibacterium sp.]|uniref:LLM class flavin-dependent oxidoreductase n=1 Tax=uncultured Amnibacterium sp. TaxID=1631851 RepID=UPI0035CA8923
MTILGTVFQSAVELERLPDTARAADAAGLEELWLWEDCFSASGIAALAATLARTERLKVGIGLLPVPLRNVALAAMEVATLERLFPGRSIIGVGHGVLDWMGQAGARAGSPLTLLGEYLDALRALLRGETVTTSGRYVSLTDVRLTWPPAVPPAVHAGAEGPKTLELVGARADGTILPGGTTPDRVRAARDRIDAGRAAAGRTDPHRVTVFLMTATGPQAQARFEAECRRWSFPADADTGVAGDAEAVAVAVRRWADAGADAVILQPPQDEADLPAFARFAAEQVRPLVP